MVRARYGVSKDRRHRRAEDGIVGVEGLRLVLSEPTHPTAGAELNRAAVVITPAIIRRRVDFPAPLGPTRRMRSPE